MVSFGERLKRARERKGLTQSQVADVTSISNKSLSRYENGASAPDPETILELLRLYDVSADYIMGLSNEMGHCAGSSLTPPEICGPDAHELFEELSADGRRKATEYLEALKVSEAAMSAGVYHSFLRSDLKNPSDDDESE